MQVWSYVLSLSEVTTFCYEVLIEYQNYLVYQFCVQPQQKNVRNLGNRQVVSLFMLDAVSLDNWQSHRSKGRTLKPHITTQKSCPKLQLQWSAVDFQFSHSYDGRCLYLNVYNDVQGSFAGSWLDFSVSAKYAVKTLCFPLDYDMSCCTWKALYQQLSWLV